MDRDRIHRDDGSWFIGLLGFRAVLDAVPVCRSLRPRRRLHRRGGESLCSESLSILRDELPALFLRRRRGHQPIYHVPCAEAGEVESGIPMDVLYSVGHPAGVYPVAAAVETE